MTAFSSRATPFILLALFALLVLAPGQTTLPPLDRDESRFAQATKQMLETGDFIEIRFQDEARNKKPVGIYWMQAATASALGGPEAAPIWAYRLPSVLGALLAVVFTYLAGAALLGRAAATAGATLFALCALLVAEGHIAKTDAMLCASITAIMAGLARTYMGARTVPEAPRAWSDMALVWGGLGASLLIKGPIGLMVCGLAVLALGLTGGGWAWLKRTRPWPGLLLTAAIVLPWAVLITIETQGAFWREAIFGDLAPKLAGGHESHGAPPGLYLALVLLTFFPASLILLPAVFRIWVNRKTAAALFLICWAVPAWIAFELFPTKLPHYVLPLYPALALAAGAWLTAQLNGEADASPRWLRIVNLTLWGIIATAVIAAVIVLPIRFGDGLGAGSIILALVLTGAVAAVLTAAASGAWRLVLPALAVFSAVFYGGLFLQALPTAEKVNLSGRLAEALKAAGYDSKRPLAIAGFDEPSIVFLTATSTKLLHEESDGEAEGAAAARFLSQQNKGFALVEEKEEALFQSRVEALGVRIERITRISGLNYSNGKLLDIAIYKTRE